MRRITWAALAALFICGTAAAQGTQFTDDVMRPSAVIPGASVRVCTSAGTGTPCTPLATIYSDQAMTAAIAGSTMTADSRGRFTFYAPAGCYQIQVSAAGFATLTYPDCRGSGTGVFSDLGVVSVGATGGLVTPTPSAPGLAQESSTGGSIADGTYYCVTTGVNLNGETTPTPQQSIVISAGTGTAQINVAVTGNELLTGAPWFKVYCGTASGGPYFLQVPKWHSFTMDNNSLKRRPATVAVSGNATRTSNIVSVTTTSQHNMDVGETFQMTGCADSTYNGTLTVATAPTNTTLTYFKAGADGTSASCTVTPTLANFVTLTLTGTASLGVGDGKLILVSGVSGCTTNPSGGYRVYSHTAVASPASSSVTFKHAGAAESGCGGAGITVAWNAGFVTDDVGSATQLIGAHLFRGAFIMTSVGLSGDNPPSTNTAAIDDVQVAVNAARNLPTFAAGQTPRVEQTVQLAPGNDQISGGKLFYGLTTPLVLTDGDRLVGVGDMQFGTFISGTNLWARTSGTGAGVNALWDDVYDLIGAVMIINSSGTTVENVSIDSPTNAMFIFMSESDAEAANNIVLRNGSYQTSGTGANCPAPLRTAARIYYFEVDRVNLTPNTTTDCFAASGHPRGAALMMSQGAGSEWVFKGPVRWTVPGKHDFIQNRKGPTDPDRGVNRGGFTQRNSLTFQNMGHMQGTAGGGTGVVCRCENTIVNSIASPGPADYNVSAGSDAAYIFGNNSYGSTGAQTFYKASLLSVGNNAATVAFTSGGSRLELIASGIGGSTPLINFGGFGNPLTAVMSDDTGGLGLCDPRNTSFFGNRSTAPTSGNNAVNCYGALGSSTANAREYGHYFQGGWIHAGFRTANDAVWWSAYDENGTRRCWYRTSADPVAANRVWCEDAADGKVQFFAPDGVTVILEIDRANSRIEVLAGQPAADGGDLGTTAVRFDTFTRAFSGGTTTFTSGPQTLDTTHQFVVCDVTSGSFTLNLPALSGNVGRVYYIKKRAAANTCTLDPSGAETIDGAATVGLTVENEARMVVAFAAGWFVF